jgi:hypothetical protein
LRSRMICCACLFNSLRGVVSQPGGRSRSACQPRAVQLRAPTERGEKRVARRHLHVDPPKGGHAKKRIHELEATFVGYWGVLGDVRRLCELRLVKIEREALHWPLRTEAAPAARSVVHLDQATQLRRRARRVATNEIGDRNAARSTVRFRAFVPSLSVSCAVIHVEPSLSGAYHVEAQYLRPFRERCSLNAWARFMSAVQRNELLAATARHLSRCPAPTYRML